MVSYLVYVDGVLLTPDEVSALLTNPELEETKKSLTYDIYTGEAKPISEKVSLIRESISYCPPNEDELFLLQRQV